ncbi:hypothetical protein A2U01_0078293, partial [Trifolium medium]|nr:hypothetical protein [Trifolium medium]
IVLVEMEDVVVVLVVHE